MGRRKVLFDTEGEIKEVKTLDSKGILIVNQLVNQSINQSVSQSVSQSINQSIKQPFGQEHADPLILFSRTNDRGPDCQSLL